MHWTRLQLLGELQYSQARFIQDLTGSSVVGTARPTCEGRHPAAADPWAAKRRHAAVPHSVTWRWCAMKAGRSEAEGVCVHENSALLFSPSGPRVDQCAAAGFPALPKQLGTCSPWPPPPLKLVLSRGEPSSRCSAPTVWWLQRARSSVAPRRRFGVALYPASVEQRSGSYRLVVGAAARRRRPAGPPAAARHSCPATPTSPPTQSLQLLWSPATRGGPRRQEHQQRRYSRGRRGASRCRHHAAGPRCPLFHGIGWSGGAGSQVCCSLDGWHSCFRQAGCHDRHRCVCGRSCCCSAWPSCAAGLPPLPHQHHLTALAAACPLTTPPTGPWLWRPTCPHQHPCRGWARTHSSPLRHQPCDASLR